MQLPEVDKKKAVLGVIGAIVVLAGVWLIMPYSNTGPLNAWLDQSQVKPGSRAVLRVEVNNQLNKDVNTLTVTVKPKDPDTILFLTEKQVNITYFGQGENRMLDFPLLVSGGAVSGRYSVLITAGLDGKELNKTVFIEVRK